MSWSKIKNIMIIILVLINLFLIVNIAINHYVSRALPREVGESFVSLLLKSGITIEEAAVPSAYEERVDIRAESYDIDLLTEIFIGGKVKYVSEGNSIVAPGGDKKLLISGDRIEYTTLKPGVDKNGRDIMKALEAISLYLPEGTYFEKETGYVKLTVNSIDVEGLYLDVILDKEGEIASLSGVWPKISVKPAESKVSVISAINSVCETLPEGSHISRIEEIYLAESDGASFTVVPAWRVYNQGRGYVVK